MFSTVSTTVPVLWLWVGADDVSERNVTTIILYRTLLLYILFWLTECEKMSVSFYFFSTLYCEIKHLQTANNVEVDRTSVYFLWIILIVY